MLNIPLTVLWSVPELILNIPLAEVVKFAQECICGFTEFFTLEKR